MIVRVPRILVVEDEPDTCENLADILTDLGYDVATANDGLAALELVKRDSFDLALLDLRMPGMGGLEVYKRIRELSAGTLAIVVTAYASSDTAKSVMSAGAWQILPKPVEISKLLNLVSQALDAPLVLVVDDDRDLCDNLWDLLRTRGCRIYLTYDLPDAEAALRARRFDVVLIDMKLPAGSGNQILQTIQQVNQDARTLIITGHTPEAEAKVQEALQTGADAVCYKPFDVDNLLTTVQELCARSRQPETPH